jgi:hypothetical protein
MTVADETTALARHSIAHSEFHEIALPELPVGNERGDKRTRVFGLIIVLAVALSSFLLASFFVFFGG